MVESTHNLVIKDDNEASLAFTSFFQSKDIGYLKAIQEYVSEKKFASIKVEVTNINDLLYEIDGQPLAVYIMNNFNCFSYEIKSFIGENVPTIRMCIERDAKKVLDYINEDTLYKEYESGKTVFDYLLESGLIQEKHIRSIYDDFNCIDKLKNKDEKLLTYLNGYTLTCSTINGVSTLEYIFQRGLATQNVVSNVSSNIEVYNLCLKYHREDLLPYLQEGVLATEVNGKTILEILLDDYHIQPKLDGVYNEKIMKILVRYGLFSYFDKAYESTFLTMIDENYTLLDALLDNGLTPKISFYSDKKILDIFVKHKRFDLVANFGVSYLVDLYNLNDTYLDILLNHKAAGENINLASMNIYSNDAHKLAMFYIIIARHGFINHINELDERLLTQNNGKLLKELLSIDKDLTLNTILSRRVKENFKVAMLLKLNGVAQKDIKIDLYSMDLIDNYFEEFNRKYREVPISEEGRALIEEFRSLMLSDKGSNPKLVEAMITSYTYLIGTNNEYGIRELQKLIEIKKKKKNFSIKETKDGAFYRELDNSIYLENVGLNTLNHETGHALFHNLTDQQIPEEYARIIFELRNNSEVLKRVEDYSKRFYIIRDTVESYVEETYMKDYKISDEEIEKIKEFLGKQQEEKKKDYLDKGYDEETVNTLLSNVFSLEEYIEQDRRIKKEELMDAVLRTEYGAFITIGDIIDSIFVGKFRSGELLNADGQVIKGAYGHGIAYYDRGVKWSFDETMANYSGIVKSVDAKEIMVYLKTIVGEQFLNCIEDYYRNQISLSTKELGDEEVSKK